MVQVFLNFDFYGAGNVGDDLMLAGFLRALKPDLDLCCALQWDCASQRRRFPRIDWEQLPPGAVSRIPDGVSLVLGLGDTPVQIQSGRWMLEKLLADA